MSVELNHTIVPARDKHASATFLSHILGVPMSPEVASLTRRSGPHGSITPNYGASGSTPTQLPTRLRSRNATPEKSRGNTANQ